jgi:hydrogenase maturation protein HypF
LEKHPTKDIVNELNNNISVKDISRKFHSTIVDMTIAICEKIRTEYRINKVVLSGGVFMNEYLLSNIYRTKK